MKHFGISILFLFIFIPLLANAENTDISKKNEESFKLFEDGFKNIINKLPPTSKIAVPEFKIQVPEFETSDKEDEKRQAAIITAEKSRIEKIRIRTERIFEKNNVRIVERESFKDVENEILLSQTGEIDPKTSAQFGKAIGATYIVLGKAIFEGYKSGNVTANIYVKVIEVESMIRIGSSTLDLYFEGASKILSQVNCNLTGLWIGNESTVEILGQKDNSINAQYVWPNSGYGSINGSIEENTVTFQYDQSNRPKGYGYWKVSPDCKTLEGQWGRSLNNWAGSWNVNKISVSEVTIDSSFIGGDILIGLIDFEEGAAKYNEELKNLNDLIEKNIGYGAMTRLRRGILYLLKFGEFDKAINDFNKAIDEYNYRSVRAYAYRGLAYAAKNQYDNALKDITQAINIQPNNTLGYICRGFIYNRKGNYSEALNDYTAAIKLEPKNALAYFGRAIVHIAMANNKTFSNDALIDFKRAIELNPNDDSFYAFRSMMYSFGNKNDSAMSDINKAIELNPNKSVYYAVRGSFQNAMSFKEKAISDFQKACNMGYSRGCTQLESLKKQ